jgi:hypothetical protein
MKLLHRFLIVMAVCALGLLIQGVLFGYLDKAKLPPGKLASPLAKFPKELPEELGPWVSVEAPLEKPYDFADDSVRRAYKNLDTGQELLLWMVYSDTGEDREHNPVVCQGVAGEIEDLSARKEVEVAGHPAPVQQYRFGSDDRHTLVYYWYYMLPSDGQEKLSGMQQFYSRVRQPAAGMTIEIFAPETAAHGAQGAIEFVKLVDAAAQPFVGPKAKRGSARRPVKVLPPPGTEGH